MRESNRTDQGRIELGGRWRLSHLVAVCGVVVAVALGAASALADAGSVYVDGNHNVGAGHDFFGAGAFSGTDNVGLTYSVMPNMTTGSHNVAVGSGALHFTTIGGENTALGFNAMTLNFDGSRNTAVGNNALFSNAGHDNVATGSRALVNNGSGYNNVASGVQALTSNQAGHDNVADGFNALLNATGSSNIGLGSGAGKSLTGGSNNIDIANPGAAGDSGAVRIGTAGKQTAVFMAGVSGTTIGGPTKAVVVNVKGRLGTAPAPTAPVPSPGGTLRRLQAENRRQSDQLQQLRSAVQRLREEVRRGG